MTGRGLVSEWLSNRWVELACRLALGGAFVYSSLDKILHPTTFAKAVYSYQLLPVEASNLLAMGLPWLELFAGLALLVGVLRTEGALLLSGLLVIFLVAMATARLRGIDVDCGCFTPSSSGRSIGLAGFAQDVVLLVFGIIVLRRALLEERGR